MADLTKINLNGSDLDIMDSVARETANSASSSASSALNKANSVEQQLAGINNYNITYDSNTLTITRA